MSTLKISSSGRNKRVGFAKNNLQNNAMSSLIQYGGLKTCLAKTKNALTIKKIYKYTFIPKL